jgi:hypothetical protein
VRHRRGSRRKKQETHTEPNKNWSMDQTTCCCPHHWNRTYRWCSKCGWSSQEADFLFLLGRHGCGINNPCKTKVANLKRKNNRRKSRFAYKYARENHQAMDMSLARRFVTVVQYSYKQRTTMIRTLSEQSSLSSILAGFKSRYTRGVGKSGKRKK